MRIGPIDFTQPSTWRGIAGFAALFGLSASPEFTSAICLALGAVLSAIEIGRNEYARQNAAPPIQQEKPAFTPIPNPFNGMRASQAMQSLPTCVVTADVERVAQLRQPLQPANDATDDLPPPPGFSNR
jgi:hypothetical protein